jgi:predicted glycoside hydrolase/deacetylase ChbG (UPF0249 family)
MTNPRSVVLCADDYGIAPGVGIAIRELLAAGRLTATTCMAVSRYWPGEAAKLARHDRGRAEIGLHVTLTDQLALAAIPGLAPERRLPSFARLAWKAFTRGLDRAAVAAEIERQVDAFADAMGRLPDFLDGHQYVHQLPVVRDALIDVIDARFDAGRVWVRVSDEMSMRVFRRGIARARALAIALPGAAMRRALDVRGLLHNQSLAGLYHFDGSRDFGAIFERFLAHAPHRGVVVCHPGRVDDALRAADPLLAPREAEWRFLRGAGMMQALARTGVRLGRFLAPAPAATVYASEPIPLERK